MIRFSCLMPTYNKFPKSQHLVEEAVESFLRQDFEDAELLIVNDASAQNIVYAHPRVRVFNMGVRFENLGAKLNAMTDIADGEYIVRFDDDDVSLPWRLSWCDRVLREYPDTDMLRPSQFWAIHEQNNKISYEGGAYAQAVVRKTAQQEIGGYKEVSFGEDQNIEQKLRTAGKVVRVPGIPKTEAFYLYRWGTGSDHLSGFGARGQGWQKIGKRVVQPGEFILNPHWRFDYVQMTKDKTKAYVEAHEKAASKLR